MREGGGEQAVARLGGLEAGAGRGQCGSGGGSTARRRQRGSEAAARLGGGSAARSTAEEAARRRQRGSEGAARLVVRRGGDSAVTEAGEEAVKSPKVVWERLQFEKDAEKRLPDQIFRALRKDHVSFFKFS